MPLRSAILVLHRWLTFLVGVFFVAVTVTGALLVFEFEIDRTLHPALYRVTPGDVGADSALAAMRSARPKARFARLRFPSAERPVYVGEIDVPRRTEVIVDPGSGRILGVRGDSFVRQVQRLHINLFAGQPGAKLVGVVGVLLVVMTVTGLYLWWPGMRKLALGFRVRWGTGTPNVTYDLHNLAGILSLPVVLLTAATGAMLTFGGATQWLAHAALRETPSRPRPAALRSEPLPGVAPLPLDEIVRIARDTIRGYQPVMISLPAKPTQAVQVRLLHPDIPSAEGGGRVAMDQYSGRVLQASSPHTGTRAQLLVYRWVFPLHVGSAGGLTMRVLWLVFGLVPLALAVTGLLVWWNRRRKRLALEIRRAKAA
ncbi:MAG TPA: PepSY-associated TM helix domain-containing protein [Gemmatimonadaceae bacterium]|nr:PepSY-associated TM helix domain-containing protein [Gemmatimonadaceae bacterium]